MPDTTTNDQQDYIDELCSRICLLKDVNTALRHRVEQQNNILADQTRRIDLLLKENSRMLELMAEDVGESL